MFSLLAWKNNKMLNEQFSCRWFERSWRPSVVMPHNYPQFVINEDYRQVSNIGRTLVGNEIVDHSDVVGASPVGAAPTASSFST